MKKGNKVFCRQISKGALLIFLLCMFIRVLDVVEGIETHILIPLVSVIAALIYIFLDNGVSK